MPWFRSGGLAAPLVLSFPLGKMCGINWNWKLQTICWARTSNGNYLVSILVLSFVSQLVNFDVDSKRVACFNKMSKVICFFRLIRSQNEMHQENALSATVSQIKLNSFIRMSSRCMALWQVKRKRKKWMKWKIGVTVKPSKTCKYLTSAIVRWHLATKSAGSCHGIS